VSSSSSSASSRLCPTPAARVDGVVGDPAWTTEQRRHLSLAQLKVMSAIEQCRSAALGGHVLLCETRPSGAEDIHHLQGGAHGAPLPRLMVLDRVN
jgi:hypothetical protein